MKIIEMKLLFVIVVVSLLTYTTIKILIIDSVIENSITNFNIDDANDILSFISKIVGLITLFFIYKTYSGYHEQKRREFSVTLLSKWTRLLTSELTAARKFVERLTPNQVKKILDMDEFTIESSDENMQFIDAIIGCNHEQDENINTEELITITQEQSIKIRWLAVSYLNNLEVIFSAWNNNVADQKMIEEQFRDLIVEEKGYTLLKTFRTAAGGSKIYPNIERFSAEIIKQNASKEGKSPL